MIEMTRDEIDDLMNGCRIGRLSMADEVGRPYAIPLPFCWANDTVYLRLPLRGRKGEILRRNDRVCFEVDSFTETLDEYASVLIEGRLVEVEALDEKAEIKAMNNAKYNRLRKGFRPGHGRATALVELPMRKIRVERISGRKKGSPTPTAAELIPA